MSGKAFLESITAADFPLPVKKGNSNGHHLIVIDSKEKVKHAMQTLIENNIYSAPVYNAQENQFIGMVDLADILCFAEKVFQETEVLGEGFLALFEQVSRFASEKVTEISDLSHNNPFVAVGDNVNLLKISEVLSHHAVRRVNIFNEKGELSNIITQSAVIDLLFKNVNKFDVSNKTVGELNIGTSPVISVDIHTRTIDALNILCEKRLYSIPVVNKELHDSLVTNLSVKDSRTVLLDPTRLHLVYKPLVEFLTELHSEEVEIRTPSFTATKNDTLGQILQKFVLNKIHRVYLLKADGSPDRVISLTDILRVIIEN